MKVPGYLSVMFKDRSIEITKLSRKTCSSLWSVWRDFGILYMNKGIDMGLFLVVFLTLDILQPKRDWWVSLRKGFLEWFYCFHFISVIIVFLCRMFKTEVCRFILRKVSMFTNTCILLTLDCNITQSAIFT